MRPGRPGPIQTLVHRLGLDDPATLRAGGGPRDGDAWPVAAAAFPRLMQALHVGSAAPALAKPPRSVQTTADSTPDQAA